MLADHTWRYGCRGGVVGYRAVGSCRVVGVRDIRGESRWVIGVLGVGLKGCRGEDYRLQGDGGSGSGLLGVRLGLGLLGVRLSGYMGCREIGLGSCRVRVWV